MDTGENEPATKSDIARLDGKIDVLDGRLGKLENTVHRIAVDQTDMRGDMRNMEDRLTSLIREESAKTTGRIDAFLSKLETYSRETATFPKTLDAHGNMLRNHEKRIAAIESSHPT